jgi:ribonuclease HII
MDLNKYKYIIGIDEVGCGCIAGPITVGFCIMDLETHKKIDRSIVKDSKALKSQSAKIKAYNYLQDKMLYSGTVSSYIKESHAETLYNLYVKAATKALDFLLETDPADCDDYILIFDGNGNNPHYHNSHFEPKADVRYPAVSAASILAKVRRDNHMIKQDNKYPGYGFAKNKGYPTLEHLQALKLLGPCLIHRMNTAPVKEYGKERT